MRFIDLLKKNPWFSIESVLLERYPDQLKNIIAYKKVFFNLLEYEIEICSIEIILEQHIEDEEPMATVDVYGIDPDSTDIHTNAVALEFVSWNKWLGMKLHTNSVNNFSELEMIVHCLYEMTFVSFDEKEIQDEFLKMKNAADAFEKKTPEEKVQDTISLKDFLNDLQNDD